jgi:hypothetical protein
MDSQLAADIAAQEAEETPAAAPPDVEVPQWADQQQQDEQQQHQQQEQQQVVDAQQQQQHVSLHEAVAVEVKVSNISRCADQPDSRQLCILFL